MAWYRALHFSSRVVSRRRLHVRHNNNSFDILQSILYVYHRTSREYNRSMHESMGRCHFYTPGAWQLFIWYNNMRVAFLCTRVQGGKVYQLQYSPRTSAQWRSQYYYYYAFPIISSTHSSFFFFLQVKVYTTQTQQKWIWNHSQHYLHSCVFVIQSI